MEKDLYTENPKFYDDFLTNPNLKTVTACFSTEFKELYNRAYVRYIDGMTLNIHFLFKYCDPLISYLIIGLRI